MCRRTSTPSRTREPKRVPAHLRARPGMTLLELTVALVVAGVVVAFGYAAFATAIDRRDRAAQASREIALATGVRRTLLRWMDGARPLIADASNADPSAFGELRFATVAPTPMRVPVTLVRLYVDDGRDGFAPGLVAILRSYSGQQQTDSMRVMLDSTVRQMQIEYLVGNDAAARQWETADNLEQSAQPVMTRLWLASGDPITGPSYTLPIDAPTALLP